MNDEKKKRRLSLPSKQIESNDNHEISGEEKRLGSRSPLLTIILLAIGPFISQTVQALYGIVNLFWVSKGIGSKGIEVFGAIYIIDYIPTAISDYLMSSIDIQLSYLFGQNNFDECAQLFIDFIRISLCFSLLMPPIILSITRPVVEWFGASKEISKMCFDYVLPSSCGSFFSFSFMCICGLLQSEGHSTVFGIAQSTTLLLNMALFCPLFLLVFKFGIWGASLATVISEFLVSLIFVIFIFKGKFTVKPKMSMFFKKFSSETFNALKIGLASLLTYFAIAIPEILLQKYLFTAAIHIDKYDAVIKVWGVIEKLFQFIGGANDSVMMSFLPSASFAFGANRFNRIIRLFFHSIWILVTINVLYSLIMVFFPRQICSIWDDDPDFLNLCGEMIPIVFYVTFLMPLEFIVPSAFQATQKAFLSTVIALITQIVPFPLFSTILYFTNKNDPVRLMWTYALGDVFSFTICFISVTPLLCKFWKEPKDECIYNKNYLSSVRLIKSENCISTPLLINDD